MNVGIIGPGTVGSTLAARLVDAGHEVTLDGRDPEKTAAVAHQTGAASAASLRDLVAASDVAVLAVPWDSVEEIASEIAPVSAGRIIVDLTNPAKPDWSGPLFAGTDSGAERLAAWLPDARVVKAFNTVTVPNMADPVVDGIVLDGYVAGDDAAAKGRVLELVASLGFAPFDVGPLTAARLLEALAWLNISLNITNGWSWQTGWKLAGAPVTAVAGAR